MNLVDHKRILELMRRANFEAILIGVESPRRSSLIETRKMQNTRGSIAKAIQKVHSYNIMVVTGMIVGFDNDDTDIFQEQFDFLMDVGTPFTTAGLLVAVERTPLYERLKREGRLLEYTFEDQQAHGSNDVNFVPMLMTREQMIEGYNWLIRSLYSYDKLLPATAEGDPGLRAGTIQRAPSEHDHGGLDLQVAAPFPFHQRCGTAAVLRRNADAGGRVASERQQACDGVDVHGDARAFPRVREKDARRSGTRRACTSVSPPRGEFANDSDARAPPLSAAGLHVEPISLDVGSRFGSADASLSDADERAARGAVHGVCVIADTLRRGSDARRAR